MQIIIDDQAHEVEVEVSGSDVIEFEVDELSSSVKDIDDLVQFEYSIKLMNPSRMSEYKNVRICKWKRCRTLNELRAFLSAKVSSVEVSGEKPDFKVVDLGYIEPGHGMKGRKQWLNTDSDVDVMYEQHAGKRNILLWAYSHVQQS